MHTIKLLALAFTLFSVYAAKCGLNHSTYRMTYSEMSNTYRPGELFAINPTSQPKKNDLILFNRVVTIDDVISRDSAALKILAKPGDSIYISGCMIYVNDSLQAFTKTQKQGYIANTKDITGYDSDLQFVNQYTGILLSDDYALLNLDSVEYASLSRSRVAIPVRNSTLINDSLVAIKIHGLFSMYDSVPPIYIPKKGDTLNIPDNALKYYSYRTGQLRQISSTKYVATENMYFVIADNWYGSFDSRRLGLIGLSDIIGILKRVPEDAAK
jgi:hypothetical protein